MIKTVAAGMGGVFVPIVIEFGVKGADIHPSVPVKISGVVGVVAGVVPLVLVATVDRFKRMKDENKYALVAFGAASLATGISILALEQFRKSSDYRFENVPLGNFNREGLTAPVGQIIKEI